MYYFYGRIVVMKRLPILLVALFATVVTAFAGPAKEQEPMIDFSHRYADVHLTMKLSKLKTLNKFMPSDLRREIGDEYYPEIRRQLKTKDSMHFKEGDASVVRYPNGQVKLSLKFPNFIMVIREVTWEELDDVFAEYFNYKRL